jgi:hypothetical protein
MKTSSPSEPSPGTSPAILMTAAAGAALIMVAVSAAYGGAAVRLLGGGGGAAWGGRGVCAKVTRSPICIEASTMAHSPTVTVGFRMGRPNSCKSFFLFVFGPADTVESF